MKRHLRFLGHPLHPALVHFPMGLLPLSVLADLLVFWTKQTFWEQFSFWILAAGLAAAVPTLLTGFLDFLAIPEQEEPAARTAQTHMMVILSALTSFGLSLFFRLEPSVSNQKVWAFCLSLLGLILLLWGGWLGGELVFKHGIGRVEK
jgi:uncharacterized membrane protein